ncbi:MAG: DUF86 domain-containing protein [Acidobacteriota bacterium]
MATASGSTDSTAKNRSAAPKKGDRVVDRDVLSAHLNALEAYLSELKSFQNIDREQFIAEPAIHHLAERYLHLACEAILDLAQHLISDQGLRQANTYRETMAVLAEENIIESELAERLAGWMDLRNILVHLYLAIDHGRAWDAIHDELDDLEQFSRTVTLLLE